MKDNRVGYMRFAVFCVFALLVADLHVSFAQSGWFWQNPLPCGNRLNDVCFVDPNTAIAVGDFGTILRTTDGGINWVLQASGTARNLNAVSFADDSNGVIATAPSDFLGGGGIVLITTDGGKNWASQSIDTTRTFLEDVSYTNANNRLVVGSQWDGVEYRAIVFRTTDGGDNWVAQPIGSTQSLTGVCFTDADNGTAVGGGSIGFGGIVLRTSDGGRNWFTQWSDAAGIFLSDVFLTDAINGTAVGSGGTILRTTDGGNHWISQASGTTESLTGVYFSDANNGTVVGGHGTILRTTDGGNSWMTIIPSSFPRPSLYAVSFTDSSNGTAVGGAGTILKTTDGGNHWFAQSRGTMHQFQDVCFTDADNGTIVGWGSGLAPDGRSDAGIILRTTDGGQSWFTQLVKPSANFRAVSFADGNTGTAVGDEGTIHTTTDGGNHWILQSSGTTQNLRDVCLTGGNTGTAVGYGGTILRTTDGGNHWIAQSSDPTFELEGVSFTDADTGTVVGSGYRGTYVEGIVLRTVDGGSHWTSQSATDDYIHCYLDAVCFTNANVGTAVGHGERKADGTYGGIILRTTNGGSTWASKFISGTNTLSGVEFTDANNGLVVAPGADIFGLIRVAGKILRTTDGGNNWAIQYTGITGRAVSFIDPNTATVVGGGGTILRTTTGGFTSVRQEQIDRTPTEFSMAQNYPNPFNPSTTIEFRIQSSQFVTLKVYDILGREVAVLVNEMRAPGNYEVRFDASGLASGVYMYRLTAGEYAESRKMILMK